MPLIALFFFYVLHLETSISSLLNFVGRGKEGLWFPLIVFGSMTIGSAIALTFKKDDGILQSAAHILGMPLILFLASLRFFPEYHLFFATLPFIAIGLVMTVMYARLSLWSLISGFFISGTVFYLMLLFSATPMAQFQVGILIGTLFLIALVQMKGLKQRLITVAMTAVIFGLNQIGYFDIPSRLHQVLVNFKDVRQLAEPRLSGLFRTDLLYLQQKDLLILQANGTRFATLPSQKHVEDKLAGKGRFVPSHDAPYVVTQPQKVLVIGPAEGANVVSALAHGVKNIWTVDINPSMYDFSLQEARPYTGGFYDRPEIHRIVGEGRHFLETTDQKFDLITLQGVQTGSQASLESSAQIESYLFTNEALMKLWDRLNENGLLYLEEYRDFFYGTPMVNQESLLSNLAHSSFQVLPISNPQQVRLISFNQAMKNPNSRQNFRRRREALFISKSPISDDTLKTLVAKVGEEAKIEVVNPADQKTAITDDRPMFIIASLAEHQTTLLLTVLIICLFLAAFSFKRGHKRESAELFLIGLIYMIFVMAISGPASLILGHPGYVAPVVYGSLLGGSLLGAWIVLKKGHSNRYLEFGLTIFLIVFVLFQSQLKDKLIGVESNAIRFATILGLGFLFGLLIEIPFIRLLNQVEGWHRAFRFFVENAGTVLAVPLGLWIQAQWGLSVSLYLCALLAVALAILRAKQILRDNG